MYLWTTWFVPILAQDAHLYIKKLLGRMRANGKKTDGFTFISCLVWEETVTVQIPTEYLLSTSRKAGATDEIAAARKRIRASKSQPSIIETTAFECWGSGTISSLGQGLIPIYGNTRESSYLFQHQLLNDMCYMRNTCCYPVAAPVRC